MTEIYDYLYDEDKVYTVPKGGSKEDYLFIKETMTGKIIACRYLLPEQPA